MWLVICSKICLRSVFPNNINYTERKKYNENESQKKMYEEHFDIYKEMHDALQTSFEHLGQIER